MTATLPPLVAKALAKAESFILGFEGDDLQEGIEEMLDQLRAARRVGGPLWDYNLAEAALCIYEAMGIAYPKPGDIEKADQWVVDMFAAWDSNGSFGMKHIAAHLAFPVQEIWAQLDIENLSDGIVFDWEFIPAILPYVEWTQIGCDQIARLNPDTLDAMRAFCRAERARQERQFWIQKARTAADKFWGYADLIKDNEDRIDAAIAAGDAPEDFARWLGEKYDLTPREEW